MKVNTAITQNVVIFDASNTSRLCSIMDISRNFFLFFIKIVDFVNMKKSLTLVHFAFEKRSACLLTRSSIDSLNTFLQIELAFATSFDN